MIFDTHSHYDDRAFDEDRESLLGSLEENGIGNIVCVGADMKSSKAAMELAHSYEFAYVAVGVHPSDTAPLTETDMEWLEQASHDEKVVAIGEIGLDYHWKEPEPEIQKKWFRRQIELAKKVNLPIVYHSREAAKDTMDMILETHAADCGGVIHCYSYAKEMAKEYVDMGFYIGVGGVITFKDGRSHPTFTYCAGDGLPLPFAGTKPRQTKRFHKLNLCGTRNCRDQRNFRAESNRRNRKKCQKVIPAG